MVERITYDGYELFEPNNGRPLLDPVCDLEAGEAGSLSFRIPPGHPFHDHRFALRSAMHEVRYLRDGVEMFRGRITKISKDDLACVVIEAEGQLAYLSDSVVRPYATYSAEDAPSGTQYVSGEVFEWEIAQHNKRVGPEKSFYAGTYPRTSQRLVNTNYATTLEDLRDVYCEGQDRYLRARSVGKQRYVDLLDGGVGEGTQAIVLGENLLSVQASREAGDIVTAIVPVGRTPSSQGEAEKYDDEDTSGEPDAGGGESLVDPPEEDFFEARSDRSIDNGYRDEAHEFTIVTLEDGPRSVGDTTVMLDHGVVSNPLLTARFGIIEEKREYEATDQEELLRLAAADLSTAKLSNQEISSCVVSAVDLHALNPDVEPIMLLDWYHLYSKPHRIDQWAPCSQIHFAIGDAASSTYRFGDLPATLTRRSALRMGMLRRGTGELIRKANGGAWNTSRAWDRADDAYHHADEIGDLLDGYKAEQGETNDLLTAGLDNVIKQYVELGGNLDQLEAYMRGEIERVDDDVLDGVAEAISVAQRTQFGICDDASSTNPKYVHVAVLGDTQGKYPFTLTHGATCTVRFENEQTESGVQLNVNGTGTFPVKTNGSDAFWLAGATITLMYDASSRCWQNCSVPIFGSKAIFGDPGQANFYTDGAKMQMRINDADHFCVDMSGERIGREGYRHVWVDDDGLDVMNGATSLIHFGVNTKEPAVGKPLISSDDSVYIKAGSEPGTQSDVYINRDFVSINGYEYVSLSSYFVRLGDYNFNDVVDILSNNIRVNLLPVILKSIIKTGNGSIYINVSASELGVDTLADYAISVTNGDRNATDCFPVGWSIDSDTLYIQFDREVSTRVRLNVLGITTRKGPMPLGDQPSPEGPDVFGDGPSAMDGPDLDASDQLAEQDGGTDGTSR